MCDHEMEPKPVKKYKNLVIYYVTFVLKIALIFHNLF